MKVHFLGIGGSGASAAAAIAQTQGFEVSGCDIEPHNEFTHPFKNSQLFTGHNPQHLVSQTSQTTSGNVNILAVTPAIFSLDPNNEELQKAKKLGIKILTWQQFLGEYLTKGKFVIAVCGTHGKTTTTAMIAKALEDAGLDPTVELGGIVPKWGKNFRVGKGHYFVIEADEFNDNFLHLKPDIVVVTTIEMDHPEYFKDFQAVKDSFEKFLLQTKNTIIANMADPVVKQILSIHPPSASPASPRRVEAEPKAVVASLRASKGVNTIIDYSKKLIDFPLQIPGIFNQLNASATFQVGLALGINPATIQKSLSNFSGVGRRFEYIGDFNPSTHSTNAQAFGSEAQARRGRTELDRSATSPSTMSSGPNGSGQVGAKVYSDFGHHPTEIRLTMEAAREKFPKERILLIYQPHMFSRTKYLFDDFVKVFRNIPADIIYIMDIYPSREVNTGTVSSKHLVKAVAKNSVIYIGSSSETLKKLKPVIKRGDIVFFMSAGDTDKLAKELVNLK